MRTLEAVGWWMLMPCLIPVEIGKDVFREMRRKKEKWKTDVRPLPRRRNSLSIASSSPSSPSSPSNKKLKHKIPPNPQLDCALLTRLPLELRLEIYAYVFGGTVIHLVQIPRRVAHTRCRLRTASDPMRDCRHAIRIPLYPRLGTVATANVALLKTCRKVYTEAAHVLYTANTFDVNRLTTFLDFSRTIIPSQLAAITSLHLSWLTSEIIIAPGQPDNFRRWTKCWCIIANDMPGLRDLKLCMASSTEFSMTAMWVKPLRQVRGLRRFELSVQDMSKARKKEATELKAVEKRLAALMTSSD